LIEYLKYGWLLNFTSAQLSVSDQRNHKGARDYREVIDLNLSKEYNLNRICGPFQSPPFEPFFTTPLNTVSKSDSQDRRVIVDSSWPLGKGVNSGIDVDSYLGAPSDFETVFKGVVKNGSKGGDWNGPQMRFRLYSLLKFKSMTSL
jgi:hypothetical protein